MLYFSEFDLKWSVYIIHAYNLATLIQVHTYMLSTLDFLLFHICSQSFIYIIVLRIASTNHATTNMALCMLK